MGGSKEQLAVRLANYDFKPTNETKARRKLQAFLEPVKRTDPEEKPTIIQHYANTFNGVDRFNKLLSHISFLPTCKTENICVLYSIFQIALVQAWALDTAWDCDNNNVDEYEYVIEFGKQLSKAL